MEFKMVKVCGGTGTYSAAPSEAVTLNLDEIARRFEGSVKAKSEHILVVKEGETEASIYRGGRVLIKNARDEEEARRVLRRIYGLPDDKTM